MMPVVRIPDELFERLQVHAKPFVDSPASVIERLLDFYETKKKGDRAPIAKRSGQTRQFDANKAPDLTHAKLLTAEFDGESAARWNDLVDVAHRHAMARLKTYDALQAATLSNISKGQRSDSGFHYLPDIDASIQGIDAVIAWRNTLHLAKRIGVPVRVEFEWRNKPGALHPGKRGTMEWTPGDR